MFTTKEFEAFNPLFSKDQFFISFLLEPDFPHKVESKKLEQILNEHLDLKDYGTVLQLGVTLIILSNPAADQNSRLSYNADSRDLSLQIQIPYEVAEKAKDLNALFSSYLLAMVAILPQLNVPDFNCIFLLRDLNKHIKNHLCEIDKTIVISASEVFYRWVFHFKGGPQFYFNKIVHPEAVEYLENEALGNLLELNIDLITYGKGLKNIYFTILADDPEDKMEGALIDYNPDECYVETILPVSYPSLLLMNQQYNRALLAMLFLTSIKFYEKAGMVDFEIEAFHRDVKALFWAEGWLDESINRK